MRRVTDVTDRLIAEARGPGESSARVTRVKGSAKITAGMQKVLDRLSHESDLTVGRWSRALVYSMPWPYVTKTDQANFVRLVKGGHVRICEVDGPPPHWSRAGSPSRGTPGQPSYYLMRVGTCPVDVPDEGVLRGSAKRRRK